MRQLIRQLVRVEAVAVVVIAWVAGALLLGLATGAGAVPTAALMALGPLLGGLLLLIMHSLELAPPDRQFARWNDLELVTQPGERAERRACCGHQQCRRQPQVLRGEPEDGTARGVAGTASSVSTGPGARPGNGPGQSW